MAKNKILKQALAFIHCYERAGYHRKRKVRKKNYKRARRIWEWQIKVYGYMKVPEEWLN